MAINFDDLYDFRASLKTHTMGIYAIINLYKLCVINNPYNLCRSYEQGILFSRISILLKYTK